MKARRYQMSVRAVSAEQTAARILDATLALFGARPYDRIRLEDVAADARVTVQTVIRRFGGKAPLIVAMVRREMDRINATRAELGSGDPAGTLHALVEHYEYYGELILKFYAEAKLAPGLVELAAEARSGHVLWCRRAFENDLPAGLDERTRERRLVQVVTVCDVSTWHLLRVDGGLEPREVECALGELLLPLLGAESGGTSSLRMT